MDTCWAAQRWAEANILADDNFMACAGDYYQNEGFSSPQNADPNCNVAGRDGLGSEVAHRSLVLGSRWPDNKGMPGLMGENVGELGHLPDDIPGRYFDGDLNDKCAFDTVCDTASGICRKKCTADSDCEVEGASCRSNGFCSVHWNPWDLVADQYHLRTLLPGDPLEAKRNDPSNVVDIALEYSNQIEAPRIKGAEPYDNVDDAQVSDLGRQWYLLETHGDEESEETKKTPTRLQDAIKAAEDKVLIFHEPGYMGTPESIAVSEGTASVDNVRSYFVPPYVRACFDSVCWRGFRYVSNHYYP